MFCLPLARTAGGFAAAPVCVSPPGSHTVSGATIRCCGCRAAVPEENGPTHPYMLSAPACWRIYGEVLAREFEDARRREAHRLAVDAYAVQHAGSRDRRNRQSVALHLMSLALVLERAGTDEQARHMLSSRARGAPEFPWLAPPEDPGHVTVLDVRAATAAGAHVKRSETGRAQPGAPGLSITRACSRGSTGTPAEWAPAGGCPSPARSRGHLHRRSQKRALSGKVRGAGR